MSACIWAARVWCASGNTKPVSTSGMDVCLVAGVMEAVLDAIATLCRLEEGREACVQAGEPSHSAASKSGLMELCCKTSCVRSV